MKKSIIAIFLFSSVICFAGWERTYYGSGANCIIQTIDGGYCIAAGSLIKINAVGDTIWTRPYGGMCIAQTPNKGFIIAALPRIGI